MRRTSSIRSRVPWMVLLAAMAIVGAIVLAVCVHDQANLQRAQSSSTRRICGVVQGCKATRDLRVDAIAARAQTLAIQPAVQAVVSRRHWPLSGAGNQSCPSAGQWLYTSSYPYLNRYTDGNCGYEILSTTLETITLGSTIGAPPTVYMEANVIIDTGATVTLPTGYVLQDNGGNLTVLGDLEAQDGTTFASFQDFFISSSGTVNIGQGATFNFVFGHGYYLWDNGGILNLNGTSTNPINITTTRGTPAPADWAGVAYTGGSGSVSYVFEYSAGAGFAYGQSNYYAGLIVLSASPSIADSTFDHNNNNGLEVVSGTPTIANDVFTNNTGSAVYYDYLPFDLSMLSNLSATGNGQNVVGISGGGSAFSGTGTWPNFGLPIVQTGQFIWISSGGSFTIASGVQAQIAGIGINPGGTVTIQAGVTLKVGGYYYAIWVNSGGTLNIEGTASQPITVTSVAASPAPGDWQGIQFRPGSAGSLTYVNVLYAGKGFNYSSSGPTYHDGIWIDGSSPVVDHTIVDYGLGNGVEVLEDSGTSAAPTLTNDVFTNNAASAVLYDFMPFDLSMLSNLSATGNGQNVVGISGGGSAFSGTGTWPNFGLPIVQTGQFIWISSGGSFTIASGVQAQVAGIDVTAGGTVTIQAGVTLKVGGYYYLMWANGGTLNFNGTAGAPITVTSAAASPAPGDWNGIAFSNGGSGTVSYVHESYGGKNAQGYSTGLLVAGGSPTIANSSFDQNSGNGLEVASGTPALAADSFTNNSGSAVQYDYFPGDLSMLSNLSASANGQNALSLVGGNDSAKGAWPNFDLPIRIPSGLVDLQSGAQLTVAPGVFLPFTNTTIKVDSGASLNIGAGVSMWFAPESNSLWVNGGSLTLAGTMSGPISLTSAGPSPLPGDWQGIVFSNGGTGTLTYTNESYAGRGWGSSPTYTAGILVVGTGPSITHSKIVQSGGNDLEVVNGGLPVLGSDSFGSVSSGHYGVTNDGWTTGQTQVSAWNCWWNSRTGPAISSNPRGTGTPVTAGVIYSPWAPYFDAPTVTVSPISGVVGSRVTVTGSGFGELEQVNIYVGGTLAGSATTPPNPQNSYSPPGILSVTLSIPNLAPGLYAVQAVGQRTGYSAMALLTVTSSSVARGGRPASGGGQPPRQGMTPRYLPAMIRIE